MRLGLLGTVEIHFYENNAHVAILFNYFKSNIYISVPPECLHYTVPLKFV